MFDLFDGSIFSLDFSVSESDGLPESEPLPESLLPDWLLLLLDELEEELEPEPDADPEPDSSSELLQNNSSKVKISPAHSPPSTHLAPPCPGGRLPNMNLFSIFRMHLS